MNTRILAALLALCIVIIICVLCIAVIDNNKEPNVAVETHLDGIILEIKENTVTTKGLTVILKNTTPRKYVYGVSFFVEEKRDDGWQRVPYIVDNFGWISIGYTLEGYSTREQEIFWEGCYGELSPGNYRIIKDICYVREPGDYDEFNVSAEFIID
ncbi:MAG: hypothetical protein FWD52_04460 [Candidatus Bathyarchaeota archaeon]|nr:hypothetical protein [Candidatus Termiticorpusculum sp.]